jgi:hypothetical protein
MIRKAMEITNMYNDASEQIGEHASMSRLALSEQERILENIPCHIMEYFQYIHLPHGNYL